jgi:predicted negative regulator of RcsB-dependent stress response
MGVLIAAVMGWFKTNPRNVVLIAGLIGVIAALGFTYAKGRSDNAKRERARDAIAVAEAIKSDTKADAVATASQVRDAEVQAAKEKELTDAVAAIPDDVPDSAAVALGCARLRQAGISTADVPACRATRR